MRNLPCQRLQIDEIWSFVGAKDKNVPLDKAFTGMGSIWTWVAMDVDTKLVPTYWIGGRDSGTARRFLDDVASRLSARIQLTTDGLSAYVETVPKVFGNDIDYSILIKMYGNDSDPNRAETRYSPGKCNGSKKAKLIGDPDPDHVSTSFIERQNLTMRMSMRRYTRLTNAFSKKAENLMHAVSLHFMHYNYCRKHQTTNMTPAQAAGVADHQWSVEEIIALLDSSDSN